MSLSSIGMKKICWHCPGHDTQSAESCYLCHGWTLPTRKNDESKTAIEWNIFVVKSTDSKQFKKQEFEKAGTSMRNDKHTAVLGVSLSDSRKAVFVYRPGGDKRLSTTTILGRPVIRCRPVVRSSARHWDAVGRCDWRKFEEIVDDSTTMGGFCKYLEIEFCSIRALIWEIVPESLSKPNNVA